MKISQESLEFLKSLQNNQKIAAGNVVAKINFEVKIHEGKYEFSASFAKKFLDEGCEFKRIFVINPEGEIESLKEELLAKDNTASSGLIEYQVTESALNNLEESLRLCAKTIRRENFDYKLEVLPLMSIEKGLGAPEKPVGAAAAASADRLGESRVIIYHAVNGELAIKFANNDLATSFYQKFAKKGINMAIHSNNSTTVFVDKSKGPGYAGVFKSKKNEIAVAFKTEEDKELFYHSLPGFHDNREFTHSNIIAQTNDTFYINPSSLPYDPGNKQKSIKLDLLPQERAR